MLAVPGFAERAGPFHSHPLAGRAGRTPVGWLGQRIPVGWPGQRTPVGWPGQRILAAGQISAPRRAPVSHTLPSRFARFARSSLARAFLARAPWNYLEEAQPKLEEAQPNDG